MKLGRLRKIMVISGLISALIGCGLKGPLYPPEKAQQPAQNSSSPATPEADLRDDGV